MDKKKEKLSKFPVVLSQLRKERGISQKKAATDLGISQALLSHYEKGIRECGLDFVIKCSEYYGVTTDYLLGVSENRNGIGADYFASEDIDYGNRNTATLSQSIKYLIGLSMANFSDNGGAKFIYDYALLSIYRAALTLAKTGILPKEMFKFDYSVARELASAAIAVQDAKTVFIEDRSRTGMGNAEKTVLNTLIEEAEEYIISNFILE